MKTVLSIAGSDCSGGAGIEADIKTITMNGAYAMSAITALTAQNTTGVRRILESEADFLGEQLDAVFEDIFPDSVKIGMVPSGDLVRVISQRLRYYKAKNIVVDPVMVSTSGSRLIKTHALRVLTEELFPIATMITPNIPEAEVLSRMEIKDEEDMQKAASAIGETWGCSVLLKGGHKSKDADDIFYVEGEFHWFRGERINNPNTHGTGCTLSSAIAANLAKGFNSVQSVKKAKEYVAAAIGAQLNLGKGSGPIMHNFEINSCSAYCKTI